MSDKPISPLRQRMIDDMTARRFKEKVQKDYLRIRRFLLHVLPSGFHRIRHYGLFAGTVRARNIERVRQLLAASKVSPDSAPAEADTYAETPSPSHRCPCCSGRMIIVETFEGARPARSPPPSRIRIDTS